MSGHSPKKIDHIGIAVKELRKAVRLYVDAFGCALLGYETVPSEKVKIALLKIGDTRIELLEATSPDSPIARFIERRGEGLHHIAFQVDDASAALSYAKRKGIQLIDETPRRGADGNDIAFLRPNSTHGVLVEFCEPVDKKTRHFLEIDSAQRYNE